MSDLKLIKESAQFNTMFMGLFNEIIIVLKGGLLCIRLMKRLKSYKRTNSQAIRRRSAAGYEKA